MPRMIFICPKCNSTYGAESGTHDICHDCKTPLIETSITVDYWRTLSNSQKEAAKHDIQDLICPHSEEPVHKQEEQQYHVRMKFCRHCGKKILEEAVVCPNCGCPVKDIIEVDESISAFMVILAFLAPGIGVFYWTINAKTRPKCAKACGIVAIIGWVFWYFIGIA